MLKTPDFGVIMLRGIWVMARFEIDVHIEQRFKGTLKKTWFKKIARQVLDNENIKPPVEIGLVITDTETVQQLNKTYRNKNEPTDVLAFAMPAWPEQQDASPLFATPPDGVNYLGEVIISYPKTVQQAGEQGHSIEHELALLTIHGVLHLLGYDHEQSIERQHMQAKERELLKKLEFNRGRA